MIEHHPARLYGRNLTVGYGQTTVLKDVDVTIPDGRITALIGANGSGKSTLLRTLARAIRPSAGTVYLDGQSIAALSNRTIARTLALLPQNPVSPDGLTVRQLCRFGRHPHRHLLSRLSGHDEEIIEWALAVTDLLPLANTNLPRLSGGQRQRAWITMALVQETPILLLDEPTTYLDMAHQLEVLEVLRSLNRDQGRTIVMVVHDLNHAALYADHIVSVVDGSIHAAGRPAELLRPDLIRTVFGVESLVIPHPVHGGPLCVPLARQGAG
ncbi:ABC transporter ATP-binding protein [Ensifer sp.]|jgi:iron complex transport system ATP-binding protein|uniref:ABC transporter ATP-binding protein n=1 Tax=Ensifer sp. TaxID=1872086 RepID=UPI002E1383D0|nr:ABC transporter ATP-binding protein [Ensifer sp.]